MQPGKKAKYISLIWEDIVNISIKEKREKQDEKNTQVLFLPTISNISAYFKNNDFKFGYFEKQTIFNLVCKFHQSYIKALINGF